MNHVFLTLMELIDDALLSVMWEQIIGSKPDHKSVRDARLSALNGKPQQQSYVPLSYSDAEAVLLEGYLRKELLPHLEEDTTR